MELTKKMYRSFVPVSLQLELLRYNDHESYRRIQAQRKERSKQRKDVIQFLSNELKKDQDPEKKNILNFLKHNEYIVLPYQFVKKYKAERVAVYPDAQAKMKYVLHDNKRMYFPRPWSDERIKKYYNWLITEQDIESPHRYETPEFHVEYGDTVADIGAAEGIFALSVVDKVKKLYLFECDEKWTEPLEKTFALWKDKATIVRKYVSDCTDDNCITLDEFFKEQKIDFIKADIEGAEMSLLNGAQQTLAREKALRMTLCTYHQQNDAEDIQQKLRECNFQTEFSKGFMIFIYDNELAPPYLRRGLIRAVRAQ